MYDVPRLSGQAGQNRLGGLSEDLDALAENNPRSVPMSAEERPTWGQDFRAAYESGAWDRALALLRHPPQDVPPDSIAFFEGDCWEPLDCPEVALRFLRAATRLDAARAVSVLTLWLPREIG
jgi:hypothetical protein